MEKRIVVDEKSYDDKVFLTLSKGTQNLLKLIEINNLSELSNYTFSDLRKFKGFGDRAETELRKFCLEHDMKLKN